MCVCVLCWSPPIAVSMWGFFSQSSPENACSSPWREQNQLSSSSLPRWASVSDFSAVSLLGFAPVSAQCLPRCRLLGGLCVRVLVPKAMAASVPPSSTRSPGMAGSKARSLVVSCFTTAFLHFCFLGARLVRSELPDCGSSPRHFGSQIAFHCCCLCSPWKEHRMYSHPGFSGLSCF